MQDSKSTQELLENATLTGNIQEVRNILFKSKIDITQLNRERLLRAIAYSPYPTNSLDEHHPLLGICLKETHAIERLFEYAVEATNEKLVKGLLDRDLIRKKKIKQVLYPKT